MMILAEAGVDELRAGIRSAVRGLWNGTFDMARFLEAMRIVLEKRLRMAWYEGARECGILPDELTDAEKMRLESEIALQVSYLPPFAADIQAKSKAAGGKLGPHMQRAEGWTVRYGQFKAMGAASACGDKKLIWVLGATIKHCVSCLKLQGKVKRANYWYTRGILPGVPGASYLACHGYGCECRLPPTTDRASPGPLPGLP